MMTNKTSLVCLTALLTAGSGCSAITNFDGLTGGDTGSEVLPDAYVPPGVDASIDAARRPDAGTDAYVPPGVDANIDAAPEPDATSDAFAPPDAFTPCPPIFRNPATVPAGAQHMSLIQTLSMTRSGNNRVADVASDARNMTGLAVMASHALVTTWSGYILRYRRDATTGLLTFDSQIGASENANGILARADGGYYTTASYRYGGSVPMLRSYPSATAATWDRGAFTTVGADFAPLPINLWGAIEAPNHMIYGAFQGRVEAVARDTRIVRVDPSFPAMPDGGDPTDVAGLGGEGRYLGIGAITADDAYLYWTTGTAAAGGAPAVPFVVSRAPFIGCGNALGAHQDVPIAAPGVLALAPHPDGRVFAAGALGLTTIRADWGGSSTVVIPHLTNVQGMKLTPDNNMLVLTGTEGTAGRILLVDVRAATPAVLRTYGEGMPDGSIPELDRPGAIQFYGEYIYISSHFANPAEGTGTANIHVFRWDPCPRVFANPATVLPTATQLSLVQTLSTAPTDSPIAGVPTDAATLVGSIAVTSTRAVVTTWNGRVLTFGRSPDGRLAAGPSFLVSENPQGAVPAAIGGFYITATYRYSFAVPLFRHYATDDFSAITHSAFTTPGDDFGPVPHVPAGFAQAPNNSIYLGFAGRPEDITRRDSRISHIDPSFPAGPDGLPDGGADVAGLSGASRFIALRAVTGGQRYLYWLQGNPITDGAPATPYQISRAPWVGCGAMIGPRESLTTGITDTSASIAVHPDGRVFVASAAGITTFSSAWTEPTTVTTPIPGLVNVQNTALTPDGRFLILTGFASVPDTGRILLIDVTGTPRVVRTYGPGAADGTFPTFERPSGIALYGSNIYISSGFATTPNIHVFTWAP